MNINISPEETIPYVSLEDQTIKFECKGDFTVSGSGRFFKNPKTLKFEKDEQFQITSSEIVKMFDN